MSKTHETVLRNSTEDWDPNALATTLGEERVVEQSLDPMAAGANKRNNNGKFFLYYFTKDMTESAADRACRTILFMTGGPGEIASPGQENFGDLDGYRVVYFHLRGSGFSQVPRSNYFDQFLRTRFAVEDIETIRNDLRVEKWRGVIGHSYGAVLAQQYAAKYHERVWKLVLSAPFSRHRLESSGSGIKIETILEKIYRFEVFNFLDNVEQDAKRKVCERVRAINETAEAKFGSVQFIIETYNTLKLPKDLAYSLEFFRALRRLRHTGWLPIDEDLFKGSPINVDTAQLYLGLVIAKEVLQQENFNIELGKSLGPGGREGADSLTKSSALLKAARDYFADSPSKNSQRAYYVFSIYDGLSRRIISKPDITQRDIGGEFHDQNPFLKRIRFPKGGSQAWNPENYPVEVPTLVLKGGADIVSDGGQAEHVFESLRGPRMLIEFPGVGHSLTLPPLMDADVFGSRHARDCLLGEFFDKDFAGFIKSPVHKAIQEAFSFVQSNPKANINENLTVSARWAY